MKKYKFAVPMIFLLAVVFAFTACGSGNGAGNAAAPSNDFALHDEVLFGWSADNVIGRAMLSESDSNRDRLTEYAAEPETAADTENSALVDRRIIRTAWLEVSTQDASELYKNVLDHVTALGGFEQSHNISHGEVRSSISATIRIPPEQLSALINFIGENGNLLHSSMDADDITDNYFDSAIRLETMRRSLESYYDLLANATTIDEIVFIQRIIDQSIAEIETLEGRLRRWDGLVSMSTVHLNIRQYDDPALARAEINWNALSAGDMGGLIRFGFLSVSNTLISIVQWLVIIVVGYSPLWLILGAGFFLFRRTLKKRKEKRNAKLQVNQNSNNQL